MIVLAAWLFIGVGAAVIYGNLRRAHRGPPDQWHRYRGVMELRKAPPPLQPLAPRHTRCT